MNGRASSNNSHTNSGIALANTGTELRLYATEDRVNLIQPGQLVRFRAVRVVLGQARRVGQQGDPARTKRGRRARHERGGGTRAV